MVGVFFVFFFLVCFCLFCLGRFGWTFGRVEVEKLKWRQTSGKNEQLDFGLAVSESPR